MINYVSWPNKTYVMHDTKKKVQKVGTKINEM